MATSPKHKLLPLIPLARDSVLLPGVTLRVPVQNRPDIPALLSSIYTRAATPKPDTSSISVGCVPLCSPLLSPEGQNLLEDAEIRVRKTAEHLAANPGRAGEKDLFEYGTVAKISGVQGRRPGELALVVEGLRRFRIERFTQFKPYMEAEVVYLDEDVPSPDDNTARELFNELKQLSRELLTLVRLTSLLPRVSSPFSAITTRRLEIFISRKELHEAGILADFMANVVEASFEEKLRVLSALDIHQRLERVNELLSRQVQGIKGNVKITSITSTTIPGQGLNITNLPQQQRDTLMRRAIGGFNSGQLPPGFSGRGGDNNDGEEEANEVDELKQKLDEAKLTPEAQKVADKELKRLRKMNPAQAEYGVCRTYLENLAEIPWTAMTEDQLGVETLKRARKQLDDDHYGLDKIKKRLLEYLAVLKLKQAVNADIEAETKRAIDQAASRRRDDLDDPLSDSSSDADVTKVQVLKSRRMVDKSPILLLVGPPGTGKTSLAKSVATALGRKFHRISLGGVRDEAEIRGHRRTYVAAMPGLIVNGLKKVGVANPVFLLDEIDKVGGSNFHGDPSAAMLEVLDPEQNHTFTDHYVNIPIDLSKVLFIATANSLDTIPPPLLDRMETIALSGYTTVEKRHIANQHLIPKQITTNGLSPGQVAFTDAVVDTIITAYTREAGVRNLEREIGSVCRFKAVEYADAQDASRPDAYNPTVSASDLEAILGIERFDEEIAATASAPGIVTGLVAYSSGGQGSILFIEVADMPGSGRVQLTGKLGDVLKESVEVALTWVKAHAYALGLAAHPADDIMKDRAIHVHCPSGAVPKDGPSAGLAHTIALISLFSAKPVPPSMAMTGEVSLRGRVLPVGGIKEKLIGALRAGVKTVLLPVANRKDVKDLPAEVKDGLEIVHVGHIWEAVRCVWPEGEWKGVEGLVGVESRL
ncbi:hypothetical protein MMC26_002629 [Xylographa opegraphella]|nr:hypothetical protein [Xylographa opegraphella]